MPVGFPIVYIGTFIKEGEGMTFAKLTGLAMLVLAVVSCSSFSAGNSAEDIASYGKWELLRYQHDGYDVVWHYRWENHTIGATGRRHERMVVYLKDGRIAKVERLGTNRERWVALLKEHGKDFKEHNQCVLENKVAPGMPMEAVLMTWGYPRIDKNSNPKVGLSKNKLPATGKLYYLHPNKTGLMPAYWVHVENGVVTNVEKAPNSKWEWEWFNDRKSALRY